MIRLEKLGVTRLSLTFILVIFTALARSQDGAEEPRESIYEEPVTRLWFNTYGNIRISKRLFWIAETHFRFQETAKTPYLGQIAQIYNRHAIGYIYNKNFFFALGGVVRLNFDTREDSEDGNLIPEYRIWHQYQFASPVWSAMVYHRVRVEHRWSKGFSEEADYIFRNRWRYMLRLKIPLNTPKLQSKSLYFSPESELIMQSGKAVVGSPMEDLRLTSTVGYIINPRITIAGGYMYSFGQQLSDGDIFRQNHTIRVHLYFSPDIRSIKNKLPEIHFRD